MIYTIIGFIFSITGWLILGYVLWRNQRAAKGSDLVDDTNFAPRLAAIVEVALHPDRAATWYRIERVLPAELNAGFTDRYVKVFPALGQDSSEQFGIRPDDGRAT